MRKIGNSERKQRGCMFCSQVVWVAHGKDRNRRCPHEECPYHELDGFSEYSEYLKSIGADTMYTVLKSLGMSL